MMIDPKLRGKVALITGANHGIGEATAFALGNQGVKVFASFFRPPCQYSEVELKRAEETGVGGDIFYRAMQQKPIAHLVNRFEEAGMTISVLEADLTDETNISKLFDVCEKELGPVDILINNHTHCVLETFDPEQTSTDGSGIFLSTAANIDAHFVVNSRAYALMMQAYLKQYLRNGLNWGRIVNTSTDAAHCHPLNVSYAASKYAIESYSHSAACEMGKYSITVNVIAPGPIQTGYILPEDEKALAKSTPLGRVGRPEDVADVTVFLCSEQARWLTGQLLYVGGGHRIP
ncbi:MAG: SDR family oxidoreductase [Candidatus Poribacteria bacterium]|nr:SDR family oxidoreductase [Candidatus Poribacteria bacterium]